MVINQQSSFLMKLRGVVTSSNLPLHFSPEAIREATDIELEFKWPSIGKRLDLRGKTTFTLGSKETAFSVERENDDFVLGIHSADVANLFPINSHLDESAFLKGKTVVFPEKKHLMIPEAVTTGFCMLREGEESFTVSVFLKVNSAGRVKSISFAESVIKVTANCEPKEVEALLFNIDVSSVGFLRYKYYSVQKQLDDMFAVGALLKSTRVGRGGTEIDTAVRVFSKKGIRGDITNVGLEKLSDPDRLVREIISAAGVEIAKFFNKNSLPCPYRHREQMSAKGNRELRAFLDSVCINSAKALDKDLVHFAVNAAHGDKNEELILAKIKELLPSVTCSLDAKYHGGFGVKHYVRFAYPASRYSDLAVQRLIKEVVSCNGDLSVADTEYMKLCATRAVLACSENEPKTKAVEKHVSDLYALDYLNNNKTKVYEGTVWKVCDDRFEICLDNGCIGYLKGDESLVLGQRVFVKVAEADLSSENVLFVRV